MNSPGLLTKPARGSRGASFSDPRRPQKIQDSWVLMTSTSKKTALSILVSGVLPAGAALLWYWHTMPQADEWKSDLLHSAVDSITSLSALFLGFFLVLAAKQRNIVGPHLWVSSALIAMGTLGFFHATLSSFNTVVWLRVISNLIGGALFAMARFQYRLVGSKPTFVPAVLTLGISTLLALVCILIPESLPQMIAQNSFTFNAKALNFAAGLLFLAAAPFFMSHYRSSEEVDYLWLLNLTLALGVSSLILPVTPLWGGVWWFRHFIRLAAYLLGLGYMLESYSKAVDAVQEAHDVLEHKVRQRTTELTAAKEELSAEIAKRKRTEELLGARLFLSEYAPTHKLDEVLWGFNLNGRKG